MKHNWEYKRLGDVCEMKSGSIISADELAEGYMYPCFGGNGIRGFIEKYSHDGNYCIIGRVGALCGNVHQFDGKFYATEHAIVVKPIHIQNVRWLYYELYSLNLRKLAKGAAQPVLSVGTLNAIKIPVPPMEVQEQIVAELDKINELIEAKREQLKLLDLLAQSLFYDTFGDPITNPKGWEMVTLKSVCSQIVDCPHSTPKKSTIPTDYPCIRTSELTDSGIDWTTMQYLDEDEYIKRIQRLKPQYGDIIYGREGTVGGCVMVPREKHFCLGQRTMMFRPSTMNAFFLLATFRSQWIRHQTEQKIVGQTVKHINIKDLIEFKIPNPPISFQEQFAAQVEAIEAQKATVEKAIAELQTLLDGRMEYWFN